MKAIYFMFMFAGLSVSALGLNFEGNPAEDSVCLWNKLSWEKMYTRPDTAKLLSGKAFELSQEMLFDEGLVQSAKLLGIAHDVTSDLDSALYYYQYALNLTQQTGDLFQRASLLSNTGLVYLHKGDLVNSLKNFLEAKRHFEVIAPGSKELAHTANNIGIVYLRIKDFEKSLDFFTQAMPLFEVHNEMRGKGALLNNLSIIYSGTGKFNKAVSTLVESIELKTQIEDMLGLCISYNMMASLMLDADSLGEALKWLHKSEDLATSIDNRSTLISAYHLKHKVFARMGNYRDAILYARLALEYSIGLGTRRLEADSYFHMANLYQKTGDHKKAAYFFQRHIGLTDSLTSQVQLGKVYDMQLEYEMLKKNEEISLLLEQQKVLDLELDKQQLLIVKRNQQIIIVAGGLGLLLLLLYSRHRKYKHVHKLKMELAIVNSKEQQMKKVLQAEVDERKRIGEELHDGLGQILSLVKMNVTDQIDNLNDDQSKERNKFQSLLLLTDNAFNELRSISHNLSPLLLQEKGLAASINDLINRIRSSKKFNIELDITGLRKPFDPLIEHSIYRIIQELLSNIMRHAEAKNISLQFVCDSDEISIIVEDDGKGFDLNKNHEGMGLKNVFTRIDNLGGTMDIDSKPGRGTIISVSIPFKEIRTYAREKISGSNDSRRSPDNS